ncbi:MAG: hypothetical protein AAGD35_02915 [Actinomycetota bacterium]
MTEASYTAWDGNLYEWPPPDGWYQAADGKWWPEGYGPSAEAGEQNGGSDGAAPTETAAAAAGAVAPAADPGPEQTGVPAQGVPAADTAASPAPAEGPGAEAEEEDALPNIDDVFGGENIYADDDSASTATEPEPSIDDLLSTDDDLVPDPGRLNPDSLLESAVEDPEPTPDPVEPPPQAPPAAVQAPPAAEPPPTADPAPPAAAEPPPSSPAPATAPTQTPGAFAAGGPAAAPPPPAETVPATEPPPPSAFDEAAQSPPDETMVVPVVRPDDEIPDPVYDVDVDPDDYGDEQADAASFGVVDYDDELDGDESLGETGMVGPDQSLGPPPAGPSLLGAGANRYDDDPDDYGDRSSDDYRADQVPDYSQGANGYAVARDDDYGTDDDYASTHADYSSGSTSDEYARNDAYSSSPRSDYGSGGGDYGRARDDYRSDHRGGPQEPRSVWPLALAGICAAILLGLLLAYLFVRGGEGTNVATGAGSGFEEPYEFGKSVALYYEGDAQEQERWLVQVLAPVSDGTGLLAEADGLGNNEILAVARVRVSYQTGAGAGDLSRLRFSSAGVSERTYEPNGCSRVTDALVLDRVLQPGESVEGNVCWRITVEDLDRLQMVAEVDAVAGRVHMALG